MNVNTEILFKLNEFCAANKIEYMVTGTVALALLGVPSNFAPQDVDIKVFHLTEEQRNKLSELQFLAGLKNDNYESLCYSFFIDGIKINAIVDNTQDYDTILDMEVSLSLQDKKHAKHHIIGVQKVEYALIDKMKLGRVKDYKYIQNLIHILTINHK
jgi:hypothetical protein